MTSTPLPEQGGFDERLDEILFSLTDQSAWDLMGTTQEQHNELTAQLIVDRHEAKQAILDWHNKQVEEVLDRLLVDVSSPSANIDQAEMIELINLYINKIEKQ